MRGCPSREENRITFSQTKHRQRRHCRTRSRQRQPTITMDVNLTSTADDVEPPPAAALVTTTATTTSNVGNTQNTETAGLTAAVAMSTSNKTLKRCLSVPILRTAPTQAATGMGLSGGGTASTMTTRSAAAAMAMANRGTPNGVVKGKHETPKKGQNAIVSTSSVQEGGNSNGAGNFAHNIHIGIPRSNPSSREVSPAPMFNIFAPRTRRYSASYSPLGTASGVGGGTASAPLCLTPRVSQLRQEECVDMVNSREANHEREMHSAMQMSQSWEDLTLVAENWSCKSDEFSNPLQVTLPSSVTSCSSPSPTSNRAGLRLPYGLSPSPTRRTFATRRSMSPSAMRPSQLGPVKRKFELEDNNSGGNWSIYSPPPLKKIFTESRGSSPVCQSPSPVCPSPDSGTYDGRITPKLFISKLCTSNNNSSACSSPSSSVSGGAVDSTSTSGICSSTSSSSASSISGGSEPMCLSIGSNVDEGISIADNDDKLQCSSTTANTTSSSSGGVQPMSTDMQDETTLMDDIKSETSSIGGCSSISIESSSCDSATKAAASFLNRLNVDDISTTASPLVQKNFFINKQGLSGAKKYIVNHDNLPNSSSEQMMDSINVSSTSGGNGGGGGGGVGRAVTVRSAEADVDGGDALMRSVESKTMLVANEQEM